MNEEQIKSHAEKISREVKQNAKIRKKRKTILFSALGCAAAAVFAINLVLFVPYTAGGYNISKYQGSEYYSLMGKIGDMTYHPYTTNNFEEWGLAPRGKMDWETSVDPPAMEGSQGTVSDDTYEEVTNNQVDGLIEGDLLKRSNKYAYYISMRNADKYEDAEGNFVFEEAGYDLTTFSIASGKKVSTFFISSAEGEYFTFGSLPEIFLSEDLKTVTVFTMCRSNGTRRLYTEAISVDVTDPANPQLKGRQYVSGGYVSARLVDGNFLLATSFSFTKPNFNDEGAYLPQAGENLDALESFSMDEILVPEICSNTSYTNLVLLSGEMEVLSHAALFSYTSEMYVSSEHLFVARNLSERVQNTGTVMDGTLEASTEIACYSYRDALKFEGKVSAKGTIVDQYSMDENKNTLRVVTTHYLRDEENTNWHPECELYVFDLTTFEQVVCIQDFSDPDEKVKSVRFDGDKAYVCTAKEVYNGTFHENYTLNEPIFCDPVFEFDLSDINHITWKDTGTISGYSMSLIKFKDDTLLGVGYGENGSEFKAEIYRTEENAVVPITRYLVKDSPFFPKEFKAYFIDAERGLLGLAIQYEEPLYDGGGQVSWKSRFSYLLLSFENDELKLLKEISLYDGSYYGFGDMCENFRAFIEDDAFYIVGSAEENGKYEVIFKKISLA